MNNEEVAPETKGVTVQLLATVDLGPEIEGMAGRQLRMRMVTIDAWWPALLGGNAWTALRLVMVPDRLRSF